MLENNSAVIRDVDDLPLSANDGATAPASALQVAGNDGTNLQVLLTDVNGRLQVDAGISKSGTSTVASVAASLTNVTLLAANVDRTGAILVNDSPNPCYAKFGATATTSDYTVKIPARGYYEVPFAYTGIIDGIWTGAATGAMKVTELEI